MLTPDLVRTRRKGDLLSITKLSPAQRGIALMLAETLLQAARESTGSTREELEAKWASLEVPAKERKLCDGLMKLVDDACEFSSLEGVDAAALRSEVFSRSAEARRAGSFARETVLSEAALALNLEPSYVEDALYGDLRGAQRLVTAPVMTSAELLQRYELAQVQAILLRAIKVIADVECASPDAYRALFHKLKFRKLLYRITPLARGYRIEIDGPYSLFDAVTKYGLELALMLPSLLNCKKLTLVAELRWGKRRDPLRFQLSNEGGEQTKTESVRDDVEALNTALSEFSAGYECALAEDLLDLPGVGLCVPDLVLTHVATGERLYLEVLGFWSREAVWRRVELVERGLSAKVLFAVSSRLRVSEEVLDESMSSALYVYKGRMSARSVVRQLDELRKRPLGAKGNGNVRTTSIA